jgi:hypothetical protein
MKALGVLILRFTQPRAPRWRVPINLHVKSLEVPVGLILITSVLFLLAGMNVLTKKIATISGISFTIVLFVVFAICERRYKRKGDKSKKRTWEQMQETGEERFRFKIKEHLSPRSLPVRSGNTLVAVCEPTNVHYLERTVETNDFNRSDVVVLFVNADVEERIEKTKEDAERVMDRRATQVFSKAVHIAEKLGKPLSLIAVSGKNPYRLILEAAQSLNSSRVVLRKSSQASLEKQRHDISDAWKQLPQSESEISVEIFPDHSKHHHVFQFSLR